MIVLELSPGIIGLLFALVGFLLGGLVVAIGFRRMMARLRTELTLAQAGHAQRGEIITALRADLEQLRTKSIALDAEKGHAERQLARAESDSTSLRGRPGGAKTALVTNAAALQSNRYKKSDEVGKSGVE